MRLIAFSEDDVAGSNMADFFISKMGFESSKETGCQSWRRGETLLTCFSPSFMSCSSFHLRPDIAIVASRHTSSSKKPALTCHPPGNFASSELGGSPNTLQKTSATHISSIHCLLVQKAADIGFDYAPTLEVTHHGPTGLPFPVVFAEIGSSLSQWSDPAAISACAESILESMESPQKFKKTLIGFGGPHYAPNFNSLTQEYAVGHIMPKYAADTACEKTIRQMMEMTRPAPNLAAIDYKGLTGPQKRNITAILDDIGLEWVKTSNLK